MGDSVDKAVYQLGLEQYFVGACLADGSVECRRLVAGEGDQAHVGVVVAESRGGCHAVEQRHVQVEHDGVGIESVGKLDRLQSVGSQAHDGELRLPFDQLA